MTCGAEAQSQAPAEAIRGPWFGTFRQQGAGPDGPILKFMPWDDGIKPTMDAKPANGAPTHSEATAKFDGKFHPEKGAPSVDAFALKIPGDHTYEVTDMKNGKVTTRARIAFSAGGKLRTSHTTGTDMNGKPVDRTVVWEGVEP
jgi:hypothetical protein